MANTESTKAFYSQTHNKQSCTFHPAGDLAHLPLSYPASITETILLHIVQYWCNQKYTISVQGLINELNYWQNYWSSEH